MIKINHTQISNEFLDNHMAELSGEAVKIFLAIARKTIGWHKETDRISYSQLQEKTGLSINGLKKAIKELIEKGIICQERKGSGRNTSTFYEINYNISQQNISQCDISQHDTIKDDNVSQHDTLKPINVSPCDTTKEIYKKNNIKKSSSSKKLDEGNNELKQLFIKTFYDNYLKLHNKKFIFTKKEIGNILNIIKYVKNKDELIKIINNAFSDQFWKHKLTPTNIYSNLNYFKNWEKSNVYKNSISKNSGNQTEPEKFKYASRKYSDLPDVPGDGKGSTNGNGNAGT